MIFIVLIFFISSTNGKLQCNFETTCNDFLIDNQWGLTDGYHPMPIDHDHTLNTSAGYYIFYQPSTGSEFKSSRIKVTDWLEPSLNGSMCFTMWYFTANPTVSFNIQFVQGDDEQLSRTVVQISNNNQTLKDWTQIKIVLPMERVKLFIEINTTNVPLVFDDLLIDYCNSPSPAPPPKILFSCDFESSCSDNFLSLPKYPYQWMVIQAGQPPQPDGNLPFYDFTYGNQSGHYVWLNKLRLYRNGLVGYLATQQAFNIQENQSYCLNFHYFQYGLVGLMKLKVFIWMFDSPNVIQLIWPSGNSNEYTYEFNRWTWAITNLPIGHYYLLFRMESGEGIFSMNSFVLDNIEIVSCDYPPLQLSSINNSFLSFSCNFDDMSQCGIKNNDDSSLIPSYNFSVYTGDTVPKPNLGPKRDHTNNSTTGGFLYWNQQLPFVPTAIGIINLNKTIEQNSGMCIQFAYYVKSFVTTNRNGTTLTLFSSNNHSQWLWTNSLDDSQGWQIVTISLSDLVQKQNFSIIINQQVISDISVAFDDISIQQCAALPFSSTTTTITTTLLPTITSTTISTTAVTTSSSTSTSMTSTESWTPVTSMTTVVPTTTQPASSTITDMPKSTTSQSNSTQRSYGSFNIWSQLIIIFFLYLFCYSI